VSIIVSAVPTNLDAFWMPFTANRQFKAAPRLLSRAEGMYYWTPEGRQILDAAAGLWCVNAGHCRREISDAVARQIAVMDYAPPFQMGHPLAFELANALVEIAPRGIDRVFFTNSGSESVDTALKIAVAFHRVRGEAGRTRFIGRERAYHGVGFGGISVGGMVNNRKFFGALLPGVDHLRHTHDAERNSYSRGLPPHGAECADDLERLVALHDASTIAAVIVEPIAGSTGVLLPPEGYLQRLRDICTKHGILLIFDEVITGFGRTGSAFAAQEFGVVPDMMTCAKGLTNGAVPMGAVLVKREIHDAFMSGPPGTIELFHGYTYSAHPVACAAGLATQKLYRAGLFEQARAMAPYWSDAVHALKGRRHVIDLRAYGLVAGIELEARAGAPGARGYEALVRAFEAGVLVRTTGDTIALSPPLIVERAQVERIFEVLGSVIDGLD
jgi:beta-alanine--pyruvate transaminase